MRAWFDEDWKRLDYLDWLRWPEGFVCPRCHGRVGWRLADSRWKCGGCDRKVSATAGTIFDKTRTPLTVWFATAWRMVGDKVGVSARPRHHRPVAVQHHPRRLVGAELHLPLHLGRRDPDLVPNHPPGRSEPHRQRRPGLVEDRARRRGHLAVATAALPPRVCQPPPDDARAVGADKPLRPAQPVQIVQALPVLVEPRPQLRVRPRIVPASRMLHDHLSRVPKWRPPLLETPDAGCNGRVFPGE